MFKAKKERVVNAYAEYIVVKNDERLVAVYGNNVKPNDLARVVEELNKVPGTKAEAKSSHVGAKKVTALTVGLPRGYGKQVNDALLRTRQLTRPKRPLAIEELTVVVCACGRADPAVSASFIICFAQKNERGFKSFEKNLKAQLKKLPVADLLNKNPYPPFKALTAAIEGVVASLGAYATNLDVCPVSEKACVLRGH